jgi:hypothetical protein
VRQEEEAPLAPARRIAWVGLLASIAALTLPTGGAGARPVPPDAVPKSVITLDKGRVHAEAWRLIAYRSDTGLWCQAVVHTQTVSACTSVQPRPNPLLISAAFQRRGPKPTTFAVISTTAEVARVTLKLVPGHLPLSRRVHELPERDRRRADLPHGYRYATIALDRVKGLRSVDAFDEAGERIGHSDGVSPLAAAAGG